MQVRYCTHEVPTFIYMIHIIIRLPPMETVGWRVTIVIWQIAILMVLMFECYFCGNINIYRLRSQHWDWDKKDKSVHADNIFELYSFAPEETHDELKEDDHKSLFTLEHWFDWCYMVLVIKWCNAWKESWNEMQKYCSYEHWKHFSNWCKFIHSWKLKYDFSHVRVPIMGSQNVLRNRL